MIAWYGNGFAFTLGQLRCKLFQLGILKHGHHGRAERLRVEFPDELLQLRVNLSFPMIRRMRNTGDLSQFLGPANQARERGAWNAMCFRDRSQAHSSQHRLHCREVAMETNLIFCCRESRGIKGWASNAHVRIKGKVLIVGFSREHNIKSSFFE